MTKVILFGLFVFTGFYSKAQSKVAVFDIDVMVQLLPEYRHIDSALKIYTDDSLVQEYNFYKKEYLKLDSSYRIDSAMNKSKAILDFRKSQMENLGFNLVNFDKIAEYKVNIKRSLLARPLYEKVLTAFKKVQQQKDYDLILKPGSYEVLSKVDNVFVMVAKELKVKLPQEIVEMGILK